MRPLRPLGFLLALLGAATASAQTVYLAPANHVDYNWNATAAQYDAAMLSELDYYLAQVDATAASPAAEQSRYVADSWWWLYLYEQNRTPAEFANLIDKIASGHITVPLNPFVTLYGTMSTEMAIRAGYYPGRIARAHGVKMLEVRVADGSLLRLIGKCLHVGVLEGVELSTSETGTAQGSVLSPLLGNVYLHYALDRWFERRVKPELHGQATPVRYADDCAPRRRGREVLMAN